MTVSPKVFSLWYNFQIMTVDVVGGSGRVAFPCYPYHHTLGRVKGHLPILLSLLKVVEVIL